eukprot:1094279-Pelagomonas_calceolata.AAC.2
MHDLAVLGCGHDRQCCDAFRTIAKTTLAQRSIRYAMVFDPQPGAINATYFLSGEPHGLKIYGEDLT